MRKTENIEKKSHMAHYSNLRIHSERLKSQLADHTTRVLEDC